LNWAIAVGPAKPENWRCLGSPPTDSYATVALSYADHGFFCDERGSYNAAAAAVASPMTLAYLQTHTQAAAKHGQP